AERTPEPGPESARYGTAAAGAGYHRPARLALAGTGVRRRADDHGAQRQDVADGAALARPTQRVLAGAWQYAAGYYRGARCATPGAHSQPGRAWVFGPSCDAECWHAQP